MEPAHYALETRGVRAEEVVGGITIFYPNGRRALPQRMRHGMGSALLERMITDSRDRSVRGLVVSTRNKTMKQFLEKKGFSFFGDLGIGEGYCLMVE